MTTGFWETLAVALGFCIGIGVGVGAFVFTIWCIREMAIKLGLWS